MNEVYNETVPGLVARDEVAQLYIHQRWGSHSRPQRELKGFARVTLQAGEMKTVTFRLGPEALRYWSTNAKAWVQEAAIGKFALTETPQR